MTKSFTKVLAAAAAASALAGMSSASLAAEVTLYGSISTGVVYSHAKELTTGGVVDAKKTNSVSMESAWYGDSIWGLTGSEDIGGGWSVGFTLENEFTSDDGNLATEGGLFDSQAYLRIGNDFVNIAAGNLGTLASAGGDFDLVGGFDPLEAAFGVGGMGTFASRDYAIANAAVIEITPIEGLKVSLMGSAGDDDGISRWADRNHYYGIGANYENGPFAAAAVVEMMQYDKVGDNDDKGMIYTLALSYDFGFVKPMAMYQHADKVRSFRDGDLRDEDGLTNNGAYTIDSFLLGATAPLGNGTLMGSLQYMKAENEAATGNNEADAFVVGLAYAYEMSKRTTLYVGATYAHGGDGLDADLSANDTFGADSGFMDRAEFNGYQFGLGLNHTF